MSAPLPPGPRGVDQFRFLIASTRDFKQPLMDMARRYGPVAGVRTRGRDMVVLSGHEAAGHVLIKNQDNYAKGIEYELLRIILGEGLLTSEGETWRRQRRLVQPLFAKRKMGEFTEHMVAATREELADGHFAGIEPGGVVDVSESMMALTLDVVGRALFGADLTGDTARRVGSALTDVLSLGTRMTRRLPTYLLSTLPRMDLEKAMELNPEGRRFQRSLASLRGVIGDLLEERRAMDDPGSDLMGMMLGVVDEETGERMSDRQLADELMTFVLAGHETTSNALAWLWRRLSLDPTVRDRMFEEVDRVLGDRDPGIDDIERLPWTRACIEESMRIDPPVWTVGRRALADDEVGGFRIPAGSSVMVLISMLHRDPAIWPNPEGFDPNRFLPENRKSRPRHAYMPFGAGRRVCVGSAFALTEAVLVTAMLARRFRFDLPAAAEVEGEAAITMRPRYGLPMSVFPRDIATEAPADTATGRGDRMPVAG